MKTIFFIGAGHGGLAALRSLQAVCLRIEVISDDDEVLHLMRKTDVLRHCVDDVCSRQGVIAGYLDFLPPQFLHDHDVLNVHYSLLPTYRGLHSVVWSILNLESKLGYTVHVVNEYMDDGPVVHQQSIMYAGETSWEIMGKLNNFVEAELGATASAYFSGHVTALVQDKNLATWVPRRNLQSCIIDFNWGSDRLKALFRALVRPYPLPALIIQGRRYEVAYSEVKERTYFSDLGRVVNIDSEGVWIKCVDSLLVVKELLDETGFVINPSSVMRLGMRLNKQ